LAVNGGNFGAGFLTLGLPKFVFFRNLPRGGIGLAELTSIFNDALAGDDKAARQMWAMVYEDLRIMAGNSLRRGSGDGGLEPTEVVHEVFLRIARNAPASWDNRRHFFGAAIRAMEHFLIDRSRGRKALKRGGGKAPVSLSILAGELVDYDRATEVASRGLIGAIDDLFKIDANAAEIARFRWFMGLNNEQTASILEIPVSQVRRDWTFAKAFLQRRLADSDES
jgi:RNA polymerase sigma factor (TIGR02999 family)